MGKQDAQREEAGWKELEEERKAKRKKGGKEAREGRTEGIRRAPGRNPNPLRGFCQDLLNFRGTPQDPPRALPRALLQEERKTARKKNAP